MDQNEANRLSAEFNVALEQVDGVMHELWVVDRASWNDLVNAAMKGTPIKRPRSLDMIGGRAVNGENIVDITTGLIRDKYREVIVTAYQDENTAWNEVKDDEPEQRHEPVPR